MRLQVQFSLYLRTWRWRSNQSSVAHLGSVSMACNILNFNSLRLSYFQQGIGAQNGSRRLTCDQGVLFSRGSLITG